MNLWLNTPSLKTQWRLWGLCIFLLGMSTPASAAIVLSETDKPLIELCALVIGGIGIFLVGIHFAGEHLQHMAGGRFEKWVGRLISSRFGVVVLGGALGFLTQSGKAAAFILADLVQVKLLTTRQAGLIVFWGNVGCSLIVFASMLSLKVFALFVLGITALGLTFHIPKRLVQTYGALFGLAMIMYGLYLVKDGAAGVASGGWMPDFIEALRGTYMLSFAAGLILTLMIQSNLAVMMIAIALASSQLLSLQETAIVIYGAQAGTGILTYIFSFHAKGRARQVVASQIAFDLVATVAFVGLFIIEIGLGIPLLLAAIETGFNKLSTQVVVLAVVFQTLSALLLVVLRQIIFPKIEAFFPPSMTESLSEPEYIHAKAAETPELGVMLIEKEQRRLLQRLPLYIDYARSESDRSQLTAPAEYHAAFRTISGLINSTLSSISRRNLNQTLGEALISVTKIQEQLANLEGYVFQIAKQVQGYREEDRASSLGQNMLESVDFLVLSAIDALESGDEMDIDMLASMTQDRSDMMVNLRNAYFQAEHELSNDARGFVLDITMLLENVVKTLSRYGQLLKQVDRNKV